jgi:hypothetical protein
MQPIVKHGFRNFRIFQTGTWSFFMPIDAESGLRVGAIFIPLMLG